MPGRQIIINGRDFLGLPLATRALLGDLGITTAKISNTYYYGNDDGTLPPSFDDLLDLVDIFRSYGLSYMMTIGTPPAGMKTQPILASVDSTGAPVRLNPTKYAVFCQWLVNQLEAIEAEGLPLPVGLSFQNEPTCETPWEGCIYSPTEYTTVMKQLRAALDSAGFANVLLFGPEDGGYANGYSWNNSVRFLGGSGFPALNDSALNAAVGAFAAHSYLWYTTDQTNEDQWISGCDLWGRDRWMLEYCYVDGPEGEDLTNHMNTAIGTARRLASDLAYVKNNYWFWWKGWESFEPLVGGTTLIEGDGINNLTKSNNYYVLRKIFKNVPPGSFVRRVSSNDPALVSTVTSRVNRMDMVAFKNGTRNVVLMVNPTNASRITNVSGLTGAVAEIHQTNGADRDLDLVARQDIVSGQISSVTLPARSIVIVKTTERNLLQNGGFDSGLNNGWAIAYGSGVVVSTNTYNGQGASKVWGNAGIRQTVTTNFTVGDELSLSAAGFLTAPEPFGWGSVTARCVNGAGAILSTTSLDFKTELVYTTKRITFTVPTGTTAVSVETSNGGGNAVFYSDDINLVQSNLLKNSGFETGTTGWTVWSLAGTLSSISSPVHGGSSATAITGVRGMEQYLTDFTIGSTLTLSVWGCVSTPITSGGGYVGLYCLDASGNSLKQVGVDFKQETSFTQKTASLTVPPGTISVKAIAVHNNGPATFYVDDLKVLH